MNAWLESFLRWFAGASKPPNIPPVIIEPPIDYELSSPKIRIQEGDVTYQNMADGTVTVTIQNLPKGTVLGVVPNTGSMERSIDEGMRIFLAPLSTPDDLTTGDVIAYQKPLEYGGELILHRITEIFVDGFGWGCKTRGDNPLIIDDDWWVIRIDWLRWLYRGVVH